MKRHVPILLNEIIQMIPEHSAVVFDWTLGHGGHTAEFVKTQSQIKQFIGCDVDPQMLEQAKAYLQEDVWDEIKKITFVNDSYANIDKVLEKTWLGSVDFILLDLGISREHVLNAERGFSIRKDGPLDMRFAPDKQTAYDFLKTVKVEQLTEAFIKLWDIKAHNAKGYAEYIKKNMSDPKNKELMKTTLGFREVMRAIRINDHTLAVIFQVLRILVNKELEQVDIFMTKLHSVLKKWGRCAIITFHSIEDRLVKYAFKALEESWDFQLVNKKVIIPHYLEVKKNKASRSAKLRVIEKL